MTPTKVIIPEYIQRILIQVYLAPSYNFTADHLYIHCIILSGSKYWYFIGSSKHLSTVQHQEYRNKLCYLEIQAEINI